MKIITNKEYEYLNACERMRDELVKEVERLTALVNAQVTDCKIGPWCKHCRHRGHDRSEVEDFIAPLGCKYVRYVDGEVDYCRKHIHSLCPEFE